MAANHFGHAGQIVCSLQSRSGWPQEGHPGVETKHNQKGVANQPAILIRKRLTHACMHNGR